MSHAEEIEVSPVEEVDGNIEEEKVRAYLKKNQDFLKKFVIEEVEPETFEEWSNERTQKDQQGNQIKPKKKLARRTSLSDWKFCLKSDKRKMLKDMTEALRKYPNKPHVLSELSLCIISALNADGANLYLMNGLGMLELHIDNPISESPKKVLDPIKIEKGTYVCAFVASTRKSLRISGNVTSDSRFPLGYRLEKEHQYHTLVMSLSHDDEELDGVIELYRKETSEEFNQEDEEIVNSYLVWGAIAIHYANLYDTLKRERSLGTFLLEVVQEIFKEMNLGFINERVLEYARNLVKAERASLFLIDEDSKELYAETFDVGSDSRLDDIEVSKEIRFPIGKGIAGVVAETGKAMIVEDAYSHKDFNKDIDGITKFKTRSILCIPIRAKEKVIGIVQMINKEENFTQEDEEASTSFAVYCGLAIKHSQLYQTIQRSEQKYKVAVEMLSYHNTCSNKDFETLKNEKNPTKLDNLDQYYFSSLHLSDMDKVKQTIFMFIDLFELRNFSRNSLIKFCLTISKNYRDLYYHNWNHGFSVANAMYAILKHNPKAFRRPERLALFTAALCHDLDHRGTTNKFLELKCSPLSQIYSTPQLEHHHFNHTVTILQQEGHNIFEKFESFGYKDLLANIKHCILATDLGSYFRTRGELIIEVEKETFSWDNSEHRLMVQAVTMTASDLCSSTKPWDVHTIIADNIYKEFYDQGDREKDVGAVPLKMMDRDSLDEQPTLQVDFFIKVCIPCYELIAILFEPCAPLLNACNENLTRWKEREDAVRLLGTTEEAEPQAQAGAEPEPQPQAQAGAEPQPQPQPQAGAGAGAEAEPQA